MSVIKTENIFKIYNEGTDLEVRALNGVSIEIDKGEFTAIVGPSGSGKTTMLNIIGGLDKPTQGNIELASTSINSLSENEMIDFRLKNIGFVFQAYNLIPVLTAQENVEFIMLMQNRPESERKSRTEELLKAVGLEAQINKRPK